MITHRREKALLAMIEQGGHLPAGKSSLNELGERLGYKGNVWSSTCRLLRRMEEDGIVWRNLSNSAGVPKGWYIDPDWAKKHLDKKVRSRLRLPPIPLRYSRPQHASSSREAVDQKARIAQLNVESLHFLLDRATKKVRAKDRRIAELEHSLKVLQREVEHLRSLLKLNQPI